MNRLSAVCAAAGAAAIIAAIVPVVPPALAAPGLAQEDVPGPGPRLIVLPPARMLVVEMRGDPDLVAGDAFNLLFSTFHYRLPGSRVAPPRVRLLNLDAPREEWIGLYAVPLPETVQGLPSGFENVRIEFWDYGTVAEILHPGAFEDEAASLRTLFAFIEEAGYVIVGPHEEIYLTGPQNGSRPEDYRTILRYQVDKAGGRP